MAKTKKKTKKKSGSWKLLVILAFIAVGGFFFFEVFGPNTASFTKDEYLYIKTNATYSDVIEAIEENNIVRDLSGFKLVAKTLKLEDNIHPGRYKITSGMSNYNLVRLLRSGMQEPVKLTIKKLRTKHDFVRLISSNLEIDSNTLSDQIRDSAFLSAYNIDTGAFMTMVMPDTYEFYWNTTTDKLLEKLSKNHKKFWTKDRINKAAQRGLTPTTATILASIVEEETNSSSDKPLIASVYINRVKIGMRLQADPTVKFAIGDFAVKRVSGAMLQSTSPYNTYVYAGIPPGPICTPSKNTLSAVINAPKTNYLYFCASPNLDGTSMFAADYNQQLRNAAAYHKALDARGIH